MPDHVFNSNPGRIEPFASMKLSSPHDGQPMARGVSDKRKTIISIHRRLELTNVIWRVNGHTRNQEAQSSQTDAQQAQSPQANVPQGQSPDVSQEQSPGESDPAANIPNQKLDAAAAAMLRIANLKRDYLQLLEDAPVDDQPRIADEASNALEKAVVDQGLSVEEYSAIVEMAQNDPQVRQKIIERMQAPAK